MRIVFRLLLIALYIIPLGIVAQKPIESPSAKQRQQEYVKSSKNTTRRSAHPVRKHYTGRYECKDMDLYAINKDGVVCYISTDEWNTLSTQEKDGYTKAGIVVKSRDLCFALSLNDSGKDEYTQEEAVSKYGSGLPTKAQIDLMASKYKSINNATRIFGGNVSLYYIYWSRTATDMDPIFYNYVDLEDGAVNSCHGKTKIKVREVLQVPGYDFPDFKYTPMQEKVCEPRETCQNLDVYVKKEGRNLFYTVDEWLSLNEEHRGQHDLIGVVVRSDDVCFCIDYKPVKCEKWKDAIAAYGNFLPSERQLAAISRYGVAIYQSINRLGGKLLPQDSYWSREEGVSGSVPNGEGLWYNLDFTGCRYGSHTYSTGGDYFKVLRVYQVPGFDFKETDEWTGYTCRTTCENLDLYAVRDGKSYFFNIDEWDRTPTYIKSKFEKKGVVIKGKKDTFCISFDVVEDDLTWENAVDKYRDGLPTKKQGTAIKSQCQAVRRALERYGVENYLEVERFWTKDCDKQSNPYVFMWMYGDADYLDVEYVKNRSHSVRVIVPLPPGSI